MLVLPSVTHGGTTFGHWGGANCPPYSAMCSSYDYDAPISEAGWATPKYHKLRELLIQYADSGQVIPDVPAPKPLIEIAPIQFTEVAPFFSNLPKLQESEDIHPMEYFDQGWGTILYRTSCPRPWLKAPCSSSTKPTTGRRSMPTASCCPARSGPSTMPTARAPHGATTAPTRSTTCRNPPSGVQSVALPSPHAVVINLGEECKVGGFRYLPRAEEGTPGAIKGYKAYVKQEAFKK